MRISYVSSDVCSSDLQEIRPVSRPCHLRGPDSHQNNLLFPSGSRARKRKHSRSAIAETRAGPPATAPQRSVRSEEHTSELQSLMRNSYAVFCLKKKIQPTVLPPTHPAQPV